jgi:hypothetical protein
MKIGILLVTTSILVFTSFESLGNDFAGAIQESRMRSAKLSCLTVTTEQMKAKQAIASNIGEEEYVTKAMEKDIGLKMLGEKAKEKDKLFQRELYGIAYNLAAGKLEEKEAKEKCIQRYIHHNS